MLIVFPSTPMTENASAFLNGQGIAHQVIEIPESLGYKTGSDIAIYLEKAETDIALLLSRHKFIVMRVFKDFRL